MIKEQIAQLNLFDKPTEESTPVTISFNKIGNFWFDSSIVGLASVLSDLGYNEENFNLYEDRLDITASDTQGVVNILNKAQKKAGNSYLNSTKNFGWIYVDGNFKLYQKTDFRMHLKNFFKGKTGRPVHGALEYPKDANKMGMDGYMDTIQIKAFLKFKEENKDSKEKKPADKGYLKEPPAYEFGEAFNIDFNEIGKIRCNFSGTMVKKADDVTGLHYPFLTGNSGEINFASNLDAPFKISKKLSFLSLFAFGNLFYLMQDNIGHYFMLYDADLLNMSDFQADCSKNLSFIKNEATWCNFDNQITGVQYEQEALMAFLVSLYFQAKSKQQYDIRKKILTKKIFTFTNDGNIFQDAKEYSSIAKIFNLFDQIELKSVIIIFQQFQERLSSGKYNTTWRNHLSQAFLNFQSVNSIVEQFLSEVKMKAKESNAFPFLNQFISICNQNFNPIMEKEKIDRCQSVGRTLGYYAADSNDRGILYALRNARTRSDFLKTLNDAQFRTYDHFKEKKRLPTVTVENTEGGNTPQKQYDNLLYISSEFLEDLPNDRVWEEYKSLVSIFAMNYYLQNVKNKSKNEQPKG